MQQLIINGSPTRLKRVAEFLEQLELNELNPNVGQTQTPATGNGQSPAGPGLELTPTHKDETDKEKAIRTRRTREQIAADNAKLAPVTQNDIKAANTAANTPRADERADGITMKEMQAFTKEKAQTQGPAIRAKLQEFGAERAGELKPEFWNAYWVFLQGL